MKIAVCDDDKLCIELVSEKIREYAKEKPDLCISFSTFTRGEMLLESTEKNGGFDIYILDVVMPGINGIELGIKLRNNGYDGKVIYLTSSEEYAFDSFKAKAFDYIIKPVKSEKLYSVLDEAIESISVKFQKSILVKTKDKNIKISLNSIMYARLEKRIVSYYLTNGKTVDSLYIRSTFPEAVSELLSDSRFVLCGAGMIANLHHITAVENEAIQFMDEHTVYIPKKVCREIRSKWCDYWFDEEDGKCQF